MNAASALIGDLNSLIKKEVSHIVKQQRNHPVRGRGEGLCSKHSTKLLLHAVRSGWNASGRVGFVEPRVSGFTGGSAGKTAVGSFPGQTLGTPGAHDHCVCVWGGCGWGVTISGKVALITLNRAHSNVAD